MFKKPLTLILAAVLLFGSVIVCYAQQGSEKTAGELNVGESFEFGWYPQTLVEDSSLVNELNALNPSMKNYGYQGCVMSYADVDYNGAKYRKVYIFSYRNKVDQEKHSYYSKCSYWFRWEPIVWKVMRVEENDVVAYSSVVLDAMNYCNESREAYWKTSDIRTWLNTTFYNTAFSEENKGAIVLKSVENKANSTYQTYGGEDTTDNVFLVSYNDLTEENGFIKVPYKAEHYNGASDYSYSQGAALGVDNGLAKADFALRDIGKTVNDVCYASALAVKPFGGNTHSEKYMDASNLFGVLPSVALGKTAVITNSTLPEATTESTTQGTSENGEPQSGEEQSSSESGGETQGSQSPKVKPCTHSETRRVVIKTASEKETGTEKLLCAKCGKVLSTVTLPKLKRITLKKTEYYFNGRAVAPAIGVSTAAGALDDYYYSVVYISRANNKAVSAVNKIGQYKAVVTLKNGYSGKREFYFSVKPVIVAQKCKAAGSVLTVRWKKSAGVDKYQVSVATDKKFKNEKVYNVSKKRLSKTVKGMKKGKAYYVRIRSVKKVKVDGVRAYMYSGWSKAQKVNIK